MRTVVVGLGVQGQKRKAVAGKGVVSTVDPYHEEANFKRIEDVPLGSYDTALLCIPDEPKIEMINYLLSHRKHVLVEKPLFAAEPTELLKLRDLSKKIRLFATPHTTIALSLTLFVCMRPFPLGVLGAYTAFVCSMETEQRD